MPLPTLHQVVAVWPMGVFTAQAPLAAQLGAIVTAHDMTGFGLTERYVASQIRLSCRDTP
jgi:hypothetical protein